MSKLKNTQEQVDYNQEPVIYCKQCLSLAVKIIDDYDYCDQCGSTNTDQMQIEQWEEAYKEKYGVEHLNKK